MLLIKYLPMQEIIPLPLLYTDIYFFQFGNHTSLNHNSIKMYFMLLPQAIVTMLQRLVPEHQSLYLHYSLVDKRVK